MSEADEQAIVEAISQREGLATTVAARAPILAGVSPPYLALIGSLIAAACGFPRPPDISCVRSQDCDTGWTCDLSSHMCVAPAIDAGVHCLLDDDCESRVCQPDGNCASAQDILYADPTGIAAGQCTPAAPCEIHFAATQTNSIRFTIRLNNGIYRLDSSLFAASSNNLTIVGGRNAIFQRITPGPVLESRDGATLTLRGVSLNKGLSCSNFARLNISNVSFDNASNELYPWLNLSMCSTAVVADSILANSPTDGIVATSGDLTITNTRISGCVANGVKSAGQHLIVVKSTIIDNGDLGIRASVQNLSIHKSTISSNHGGGISGTGGIFDITNNLVFRNGNDANGEFGGLRLDTNLPGNRVIHNTIDRNDSNPIANPLYAGGFFCRGGGSFINNLIVNNFAGSATQPNAQVGGTCDLTGSLIADDDTSAHFISAVSLPYNLHLADSGSQAVNAGISGPAPETEDFDDDPRSDGAPDIGADELKR